MNDRRGSSSPGWPALVLLLIAPLARGEVLQGQVFLDANANGLLDPTEHGVAGVALSNGREVVRSDKSGRYQIALDIGDTLFLIKPAGYRLPTRDDGLADFWQHHAPNGLGTELRYAGLAPSRANGLFALLAEAPADPLAPLDVLVMADPQPKTVRDVEYFRRDIIAPIADQPGASMGVVLGDVVNDDLDLFKGVRGALNQLSIPFLMVSGNHDIDFDAERDELSLLSYRQSFGPDTFAWEEPQAVFVALDDVIYSGSESRRYVGGLREDQFGFLQAYLDSLSAERLLVLMVHVPLFNAFERGGQSFRAEDRERLFTLLQRFERVLVLSGHSHKQRHYFHTEADGWGGAKPLHEYNVGTACGGYWSGVIDAEGIPDSRMADGTPNGFARLQIAASGEYSLRYEVAREPDHPGIELFAPKVLRRGSWPGVGVYANVLMGKADSRVEMRIDDGEWVPMRYTPGLDRQVLGENLKDDSSEQLRGFDRLPEAEVSYHLWRPTPYRSACFRSLAG